MSEVRYGKAGDEELVKKLPRRVAHAAFAVLEATAQGVPATPSEAILFDQESPSLAAFCSALRRAIDRGLVDRWGRGVYVPTMRAHDLRTLLEDRYLADTADKGEAGA
ncbi:MAG TPA: hypothetical protein VFJ76_07910 [Solirubrobacterales bacterium]|nr:hypothetical protein [Solirubrobacterales bacterium]